MAAGITLPTKNIEKFRKRINDYYKNQSLKNQQSLLLPKADATASLDEITEELVQQISQLEPFGAGNPQPVIECNELTVLKTKKMGSDSQHIKLSLIDKAGLTMDFLSFNAPDSFCVKEGALVSVWFQPNVNEWHGNCSVEGQILHIEPKV
jgi:single-stranded-DNA-specific exonuclease